MYFQDDSFAMATLVFRSNSMMPQRLDTLDVFGPTTKLMTIFHEIAKLKPRGLSEQHLLKKLEFIWK